MRETLLLIALLLAAPAALAQEEPTVNDSDYDTSTPPGDESYLDEAEAEANGEPTVADGDFDTSVPADDQSYLDDAEAEIGDGGATGSGSARDDSETPGIGPLALIAALGVLALAWPRR